MVLTVQRLSKHVEHSLGGSGSQSSFAPLEIINAAGHSMTNAHPWSYLDNGTEALDLVAGQEYVALPITTRRLTALQVQDSRTHYRRWSSLEKLLGLRQSHTGIPNGFDIALNYRQVANDEPIRVIELWPTPSDDRVGFFVAFFQQKWAEVVSDNDQVAIPDWMEPCLIEFVRETALGWQYPDAGTPGQRLAAVKVGQVFLDAAATDGEMAGPLGLTENGAASAESGYFWLSFSDAPILNSPQ